MIQPSQPHDLRVEHLTTPLGVGPEAPRLSWKLPAGARVQHAYRIVAGDVDTGRVESTESTFREVAVVPRSGRRVEWRVQTWTDAGQSEWSAPSWWEHGLLAPSDWSARWIAPTEASGGPPRRRPVQQLAGPVRLDEPVTSARLHATAHGVYEAFVNGTRVGDLELTPGFTAYRMNLQVQTYDVTALLRAGDNVLGARLSDGWWRGQNSVARRVDDYGTTTAFVAQLVVTLASGAVVTFGTDGSWCSTPSAITGADLISGESHDLRRHAAWEDWSSWDAVRVEDHGFDRLCASPSPPVRRIEERAPTTVHQLAPNKWVVDFGQNINGWVRLGRLGPTGTETTLTYGEWLDHDGDVTQAHIDAPASTQADSSLAFQTDAVVSGGHHGEEFEPRHSTKGFQYVRVEGHDGTLDATDITAVVVHTDLAPVGTFSCSDERANAIHRIARWSFRGNACDIPTDCPTRERAGWTGDWQIYVETASFLYDVAGFSAKWLRDLAAEQRRDGKVTNLVPETHPGDDRPPPFWPLIEGSSGWGDAAVHVPWTIYRVTGGRKVLADQWESMCRWVDFAAKAAATGRHPSRVERSAAPRPHERFLWDSGWHFGEWLEPGDHLQDAIASAMSADHGAVATAYLHRSAQQLADIAMLLDHRAEATRYAELADHVADAWRTEFLADDGTTTPDTQATYTRALMFGLVPRDRRDAAATRLVELIRTAGTHVGTGFLATPFLLPVLADHGHLEVAYELLFQDSEPSWSVMVDRGATSVWEEWGGVTADGTPNASLNHYSKGAVITFLYQYVAGLQLMEPGYRRFRVGPRPGGGVRHARAHHDSPYGRIEVSWEIRSDEGTLDVTVPPGTTGELVLPDGTTDTVGPGDHRRTWVPTASLDVHP